MNLNINPVNSDKPEFRWLGFNFERIVQAFLYIEPTIKEFVDASAGAVSRYLPDGNKENCKQYFYCKSDSSVNAVTIYPYSTQLINAGASTALAAQGNKVTLAFDKASQSWWIIA